MPFALYAESLVDHVREPLSVTQSPLYLQEKNERVRGDGFERKEGRQAGRKEESAKNEETAKKKEEEARETSQGVERRLPV